VFFLALFREVDDNEAFDCMEALNRDAEDKYFDDEDSVDCPS
jgi:hypothetical protein